MKNNYPLIALFCIVISYSLSTNSAQVQCGQYSSENSLMSLEKDIPWSIYFNKLYKNALDCHEMANIGILNIIDESGYPVGLPIHFEFKNNFFYFASSALSKRNQNISKNHNISLLIYYKSLNQSTVLIKGQAFATPIKYQYLGSDAKHNQIIYKIEPTEVNVSFLNEKTQNKEEITRHLYTFYKDAKNSTDTWFHSKRSISIETRLDDLEEKMKQKNHQPLSALLP